MLSITEKTRSQERIVAVVDIATSKIACMVVAMPSHAARDHVIGRPLPARLLGVSHQRSRGVKAGAVVDLSQAEEAVRGAVAGAERMAGVTVQDVIVSVSCGRLKSLNFTARAKVRSGLVQDPEITRVVRAARDFAVKDGQWLLHLSSLGYGLDASAGIRDPRGMTGERLSMDVHAVTADEAPLRNLVHLIERCHLNVEGLVATPYASGLATVSAEEARLGVTCIDMGAGTTTLSVFAEGHFVYSDAIALGGGHITYDIARFLSTPLYEAERIKTLYGSLVRAGSDEHELVSYSVIGQDEEVGLYQTDKARLRDIIRPRIEETLHAVRERLEASGFAHDAGQRVVLTGGASQLIGLGEFAAQVLGKPVRVGRPAGFAGAPENVGAPSFAAANGLLHALLIPGEADLAARDSTGLAAGTGYLGRVGHWLRQSFWEDEGQFAKRA